MVDSMFTPASKELTRALIAMRKEAGLTQRALAEAVGREQNYVARIEIGERRLNLVELIVLIRACGKDPEREVPELVRRVGALVPHSWSAKRRARK